MRRFVAALVVAVAFCGFSAPGALSHGASYQWLVTALATEVFEGVGVVTLSRQRSRMHATVRMAPATGG